jgi:type III secretory pathway component EscV
MGDAGVIGSAGGALRAGGDVVELAVPPAVGAMFEDAGPGALDRIVDGARRRLYEELGVRAPLVRVRIDDGVRADEAELRLFGIAVEWMAAPHVAGELEARLDGALARHAGELIRAGAVQAALDELGPGQAALVRDVVPRVVSMAMLVEVLRRLVREGISVRDLAGVLEALALAPLPPAGTPRDAATLAEQVRAHLGRAISGAVAPRGQLSAWTLDPMIEDAVRGAIVTRDGGAIVALEPALARDIVAAVKKSLGERGVVLASGDVRRHLRTVLEPELPGVAVVAPHELSSGVTVRAKGRIEV